MGQKFGTVNTTTFHFQILDKGRYNCSVVTAGVNLSALGSMGAEGDPITGEFFLRAANPNNSDIEDSFCF